MVGEYSMVNPEGRRFKVSIPAFSLGFRPTGSGC